jgi:uncharacterized protein YceK
MKKIFILVLVLVLVGCTSLQKSAIKVSEIDLKNAEASREVAKNLLSTWKLNSGFIRGSLGDAINQFPHEAVKAMDELDKLSEKTEWNDFDLGYSLGARVRLAGEIIVQAIKHYFPKLLEYITLPF